MTLLALRLIAVFTAGVCLGSIVNWAIYALAWTPRPISPWSRLPGELATRFRSDRIPIFGWVRLKREAKFFGRGFWIRPLLIEVVFGVFLAWLYWWEVEQMALIQPQVDPLTIIPPIFALHLQFVSHSILLCWMLAASFVDIDEKIIPDEITVSGTLVGLLFAAVAPMSLLPDIQERMAAPTSTLGVELQPTGRILVGPNGGQLWMMPTTAVSPNDWPPTWGRPHEWPSLVVGLACYWLWCFALAPRIWRGRRGVAFAINLIVHRLWREFRRGPMLWLWALGSIAIASVWAQSAQSWEGLLTALLGLVGSGGLVWAVRIIGSFSLRREAMGFGDVTLMMMIGTFLGWQACVILFFISPFAALLIGALQFAVRRDDVIPFGPFLCLAAGAVVVSWASIWIWAQPLFEHSVLVPGALSVCLILLGIMLTISRFVKNTLFGRPLANE